MPLFSRKGEGGPIGGGDVAVVEATLGVADEVDSPEGKQDEWWTSTTV